MLRVSRQERDRRFCIAGVALHSRDGQAPAAAVLSLASTGGGEDRIRLSFHGETRRGSSGVLELDANTAGLDPWLLRVADFDSDGSEDVLVGLPGLPNADTQNSELFVVSTLTTSILWRAVMNARDHLLGAGSCATVDLDQDGTADIATFVSTSPRDDAPVLVAYSGRDGKELRRCVLSGFVGPAAMTVLRPCAPSGVELTEPRFLVAGECQQRNALQVALIAGMDDTRGSSKSLPSLGAEVSTPVIVSWPKSDGTGQAAIGVPRADVGSGIVLLARSCEAGVDSIGIIEPSIEAYRFGEYLMCVSDVDHDGESDLLIGGWSGQSGPAILELRSSKDTRRAIWSHLLR